jgi:hypothetical protein
LFNYLRHLAFYILSVLDAVINLCCCLVGYYPTVDISSSFLVFLEMRKIQSVIDGSTHNRKEKEREADEKVQKAKVILDGKD